MTIKFANRVKVLSSTTGTGAITLGASVESFQTFSEGGILDGNTVRYTIVEVNDWEVGTGVYTHSGTTLSRTLEESSTGSLLNLAGEQEVFITTSATDIENLGNRSIDYFYFTATAGQTAFTGNDDSSNQLAFYEDNVLVFMNGVVLEGSGQDYTVTGGDTITLSTGASVSDELNVVAFKSFTVADAVPKSTGGQFDANVDFAAGIDVTGNITVTGTVDGRDVATDGTKLDGIQAGATNYVHPSNHAISVITGLQTALDGKVDDSQVLTNVPSGAVFTDTVYSVGDGGLTQVNFTTADNTKLDGIEASATADQTKADIDALNVDADTLDGQHGAYYTGYTDTAVANLVDSSPSTLDTLNELAAALGDDPNFATTTATNIGTKVSKAGDTMTGNLSFGDNDKAVFGAELEIYSDGTHARIREYGSGQFKIQGDNMQLLTSAGTATYLEGNASTGAVTLYHASNAPRVATTATGIDVTGTVTADGLTVDNISADGNTLSTTSSFLLVQPATSFIADSPSSTLNLRTQSLDRLLVANNGDISFYEDTGTTPKLTWSAGNERLGLTGSDYQFYLQQGANQPWYHRAISNGKYALHLNGTGDIMTLDTSGNVGIGTANPYTKLELSAPDPILRFNDSNGTANSKNFEIRYVGITSPDIDGLYFRTVNDANNVYADKMVILGNGDLHVDGNVIAYSTTISDERLKTDIVKIDGALDKVAQLNGYTFTYTADGKKSAGVIAQEVKKVLPSAITESTLPLKMGEDDETEYMTVQYDQLMGLMVEAIKELKAEVAELKGK